MRGWRLLLLGPVLTLAGVPSAGAEPDSAAAQKLKVAWASQYEWREDDVLNATLNFRYTLEHVMPGGNKSKHEGAGQAVLNDKGLARVHMPGAYGGNAGTVREHLRWIAARFVREPFPKEFEAFEISELKDRPDGSQSVSVVWVGTPEERKKRAEKKEDEKPRPKPPATYWLLKNDRLVAQEVPINSGQKGAIFRVRYDYTSQEARGGYMIIARSSDYRRQNRQHTDKRRLTLGKQGEVPVPDSYKAEWKYGAASGSLLLEFSGVRTNSPNPIILEPATRDLVKAAWEKRYTLPENIRVDGKFLRRSKRRRVASRVEGEFQVYGMKDITAAHRDKRVEKSYSKNRIDQLNNQLTDDFRGIFDHLRTRPFDEEFKGVGFRAGKDGKATIVALLGYGRAAALRIEKGVITATQENRSDDEEVWWSLKHKKLPDGKLLLERISRKIDGDNVDLKISYAKKGDFHLPKKFGVLKWQWRSFAVDEFTLKGVKAELPKDS